MIDPRLIDDTKVVSTEVHLHEWSTFLLRYTVPMIDQNCYKSTSTILGVVPEVLSRFVLELLHRYFHDSLYLLQRYFHDSLYLLEVLELLIRFVTEVLPRIRLELLQR